MKMDTYVKAVLTVIALGACDNRVQFRHAAEQGRGAKLARGDLPRFFQPVITENFSIAAKSFGVR